MMCLEVGLFASIIIGILCASSTHMSISFTKLRNFSFIIFSSRFPISCSFSFPSGTPMRWMLDLLKLSQRLLILSSFFWILLPSSCSAWFVCLFVCFLVSNVPNHWSDTWLHSFYCCFLVYCSLFQLVYPSFLTGSFLGSWGSLLSSLSTFILSVLNFASDRLLIHFVQLFFWIFDLFFHLGHISLSPHFGSLPVFASMH